MKQYDNLNPKGDALKEHIEATARQTNPNPVFQSELEKRLIDAHKPKAGFTLPSTKEFVPMLGWALVIVLLVFGFNWMLRALNPVQMPVSNDNSCAVTQPNGSMPPGESVESPDYLGNGELWTVLWPNGKIIMSPENQRTDGSFDMKWVWWRGVIGTLTIEGHRLDAEDEPLRADIPDGYGDTGFQVSALIFPSAGCWEVTGRVGDSSLTFVTEVIFGEATQIPDITIDNPSPTPTPEGDAYNWNGTTLYLNAPLPEQPAKAGVYLTQAEGPATLESARALANQFGMQGQIYETEGEVAGTTNLAVVDGRQRLYVRSDRYFTYYADYTASTLGNTTMDNSNAEALIDAFIKSHGFDFAYRIERSELYGAYIAVPLAADGLALHLDYFKANGLLFRLNDTGIIQVEASLMKYEQVDTYGLRTAQQAFDQLLDPDTASVGVIMGMHSVSAPPETWVRVRPQDQTVTIYGWMKSIKSAEGGAALVTLDGYTITGDLAGIPEAMPNTFVEATGKLHTESNMATFELESWKPYDGYEDGLEGTLQRQGDQVLLTTLENETFTLPDVPADLSLPTGTVFVVGVKRGDVFEWKSFDLRLSQGGGGGGGGGTGIHKLNLTGTPMPLPTPEPVTSPQVGGQYIVKEGDTLSAIAQASGVSLDTLMQANGLANPGMLFVGQVLIIPSESNQPIENLRGILTVNIINQVDGNKRVEYGFISSDPTYPYMVLEGDDLQSLQNYHNRPINIWGKIDHINNIGVTIVKVEKFEVPFPDLKFQILKGTEKTINIQGQTALLFTSSEDGKSYVQLASNCHDVIGPESVTGTGKAGEPLLLEVLAIPDLTFGDYPAICVYSTTMAINPKNGQPVELTVTADQPYIMEEATPGDRGPIPTATIEKVELVYYIADPRYGVLDPTADPLYIQPMWRFTGHYSNGDEFEILVQALKDEFLSPEIQTIQGPG
jgi:LysM repeat protein